MSKPAPPSRTADQFVVRFPDGMRDLLAEAARRGGRSMNAEIVARVRATFDRDQFEGLVKLVAAHRARQEAWEPGYAATEEGDMDRRRTALDIKAKIEEVLEASPPVERLHEEIADGKEARTQAAMLAEIYDLLERQKSEQEKNLPTVMATLERELAIAAMERWSLKSKLHNSGHAIQALVRLLDEGEKLQADHREKLLNLAYEWCQGAEHHENPLAAVQRDLDAAAAKVDEIGRALAFDLAPPLGRRNDEQVPVQATPPVHVPPAKRRTIGRTPRKS